MSAQVVMGIEIKDVDNGLGNVILMKGVITESEFVGKMQRHLNQDPETYKRYRFSLTDISETTEINLSTDAIVEHSRACIRSAHINPDAVVAVVAPKDLGFGLSRMWEILCEEIFWETNVFRTREEARKWIRKCVKQRWGITDLTMGEN